MDDESLNGTFKVGESKKAETVSVPKSTLRDRILDYVANTSKPTKGGIFINVSSSGTAGAIVSALISEGVFIEKKFDCGTCVYFEIDPKKAKINIV